MVECLCNIKNISSWDILTCEPSSAKNAHFVFLADEGSWIEISYDVILMLCSFPEISYDVILMLCSFPEISFDVISMLCSFAQPSLHKCSDETVQRHVYNI